MYICRSVYAYKWHTPTDDYYINFENNNNNNNDCKNINLHKFVLIKYVKYKYYCSKYYYNNINKSININIKMHKIA